jgi:Zn-finger nucleic acid-binding protein
VLNQSFKWREELTEEEIRPQKLFDELLRLNKIDSDVFFRDSYYQKITCPVCDTEGKFVFNKNGFNFDECGKCKSIYMSPRPDKRSFNKYYTSSDSAKFWATTFYKLTAEDRRKKIWKPKSKLVYEKILKYSRDAKVILDIGGGYGVFMDEFLKLGSKLNGVIIEPSRQLASICITKSHNVIEKFLEDVKKDDLDQQKKIFVSFELFEHLQCPKIFLEVLYNLMDSDDLFVFTTLSGMGVDVQVLWEHSKAISPPMHLNFFNPKSIQVLLEKNGFEVLEVSTPGKLDIDILSNNKKNIKDHFWKNFLEYSSQDEKNEMQKYISKNNLSSHMMVVCKKG